MCPERLPVPRDIPPTEIFRGTKLDYGDVCLVPSDVPENESKTSKARGEIAIAMLPHGNQSADITFLNARTMYKIVRNTFTVIPTPQFVVEYLKQHVGNRFAATRRNPIYRTIRGELEDDAHQDPIQEAPQQAAEAAEPVIQVNREMRVHVEEDNGQDELPMQDQPAPTAEPRPEPAPPSDDPMPVPEEQQPLANVDVEQPEAEAEGAPVLNIEDLRRRYPVRMNRSTWKERSYFTSRATAAKLKANDKLNLEPRQRLRAMAKEIYSIAVLKKGLMTPINPHKLTHKQLKGVISSKLFTKAKFSPDGEFEKWKARLVAGGHMQNREEYTHTETSSPAVGATAVLAVAAIAAKERRKTATIDFTAAYLNASMKDDKLILMRLSKETSGILCLHTAST